MSDPITTEITAQFAVKVNELHGRAHHLCTQLRRDPQQDLTFWREMVRDSLRSVDFWLSEMERPADAAQDLDNEVRK